MNFNFISEVSHGLISYSDSIFFGLKIWIPIVFVLYLWKSISAHLLMPIWIKSSNFLLLLAGTLFMMSILLNVFFAWLTQNEDERNMMLHYVTGSNWYQIFIPVFIYGILPGILWINYLRNSIYASFNIVLVWVLAEIWLDSISKAKSPDFLYDLEKNWYEYMLKAILFSVSFLIVFVFNKYQSRHKS